MELPSVRPRVEDIHLLFVYDELDEEDILNASKCRKRSGFEAVGGRARTL